MKTRCEGQRRKGGAFTFGPVVWTQCSNDAAVNLTVVQAGKKSEMPACMDCWSEAIAYGITIKKAEPLNVSNMMPFAHSIDQGKEADDAKS